MKLENTSVKVFGKKVKIKFGENLVINGHPVFGYFDTDKWTIFIDKNQDEKHIADTLLHEIGHALMHRLYFDGIIDPATIELIVESFAKVITENFKLQKK